MINCLFMPTMSTAVLFATFDYMVLMFRMVVAVFVVFHLVMLPKSNTPGNAFPLNRFSKAGGTSTGNEHLNFFKGCGEQSFFLNA
jgi:hypothetical protein